MTDTTRTKQRIQSCLRTYTELEEDRCKDLAKEFTERVKRELNRQELESPDITIKPKSSKKIVFEADLRNCTRAPQQILEDYLKRNDRSTDGWAIKQREDIGSKTRIVCTQGVRGSTSNGSSSSSKDATEEAKEAVSQLDDDQKEMLAKLLD